MPDEVVKAIPDHKVFPVVATTATTAVTTAPDPTFAVLAIVATTVGTSTASIGRPCNAEVVHKITNRESTASTVVTSFTLSVPEKIGGVEPTLSIPANGPGSHGLPVSTVGTHPIILSTMTPTSNIVIVASSVFTVS